MVGTKLEFATPDERRILEAYVRLGNLVDAIAAAGLSYSDGKDRLHALYDRIGAGDILDVMLWLTQEETAPAEPSAIADPTPARIPTGRMRRTPVPTYMSTGRMGRW